MWSSPRTKHLEAPTSSYTTGPKEIGKKEQ
jgi:hypothetical protein